MRAPHLFALAVVGCFAVSPVLAQDPVDSLPSVDQPDTTWSDDPDTLPEHPARARGERNPYLRQVGEHSRRSAFHRGPYWVTAGLGAGGEAIAAPGTLSPYSPSRIRPTLSLGVGATAGQVLRLGLDGFAWFNVTGESELETITTVFLGGRVYPIPRNGLYLRAGAGFGHYRLDPLDDLCDCAGPLVSDGGFAWVVGGGFEVPAGRGLWIGPSVDLIRMNVPGPDGYRERVLNLGITITYDGN
jgi:hypothetical protein